MKARRQFISLILFIFLLTAFGRHAAAYSLLTHEQLIDLAWNDSIAPLLLSRYPNLTPADLDRARAYAYGGCVIQDIGYYPFGDSSFSNLTHYVRTGDFVVNLFRNAQNANELAFAVGALSHYFGDSEGHPLATNLAVPIEFPKLGAKYGREVNYAEGRRQHVRTEFAFDINDIAKHRVAPVHYLRHIGLEVSVRQLRIAFYQTYGLYEDFSGKRGRRINVSAYRFAVRSFIPRIAYAVTLLHRKSEPPDPVTPEFVEIQKMVTAMAAENHWDDYRRKAGIGTWSLACLLFVLPKVGPLSLVAVKGPTPATEADYIHSVALSTLALREMLARFTPPSSRRPLVTNGAAYNPAALHALNEPPPTHELPGNPAVNHETEKQRSDPRHPLPNRDLDTGRVVQPGGYSLTDSTYADLLHVLASQPAQPIPPGIKEDIQTYYANLDLPISTKRYPQRWNQVLADLKVLGTMPVSEEPVPFPTYDDAEVAQ